MSDMGKNIQIRDVPEEVHRIYRARAAEEGQSLEEYLLDELVTNAALRTPAEVATAVEHRIRAEGEDGFAGASAVETVRGDRESH